MFAAPKKEPSTKLGPSVRRRTIEEKVATASIALPGTGVDVDFETDTVKVDDELSRENHAENGKP